MSYRVLLVGGGTGGHVYPLVAVARALKERAQSLGVPLDVRMMGDGMFAQRAAEEAGIPLIRTIAPKLRRYASAGNLFDILKIPFALAQSLARLWWFMPDVVFAKGGYTCAFPTLAARWYMIPVYLHESDSVPGLANRMLAKRAKIVFTAFASAEQYFSALGRTVRLVGNPIRRELAGIDRAAAHAALQLDASKKTIFITGGSQGAQQLNDVVLNGLVQMLQKGYQIIHQAGDRNFASVKQAVEQYITEGGETYGALIGANYRVYPFLDRSQMATALAAADIVVSRAGAEALTELSYLGKPSIIIPLAGSANDHQLYNAAEFSKFGAAVMDSANVSVQVLLHQIEKLSDNASLAAASERIRGFAKTDAAEQIAAVLLGR
jgi:UDP-N-acetylglucosamine--N-acetylmuramyl-(pentapeptide) pyrophosphoryl-undecaprenol N-acetylglucosamine transferase